MSALTTGKARSPLSNGTNSRSSDSSSPFSTARSAQPKQLRRKVSFRTFAGNLDSSEEEPSEHWSVYDAQYLSSSVLSVLADNKENKGGLRIVLGDNTQPSPPVPNPGSGEDTLLGDRSASPSSSLTKFQSRQNRRSGTPLETITEQRSIATLRPSRSLPRRNLLYGNIPTLEPTEGVFADQARHKRSFSFDDLDLHKATKPKSEDDPSVDSSTSLDTIYRDYAYPNQPTHSPPHRLQTPPGVPKWPGPRAVPAAGPLARDNTTNSPSMIGRLFSFGSSSQRVALPSGVTTQRARRYRPPQSGHGNYGGALDRHPFHQAPLAEIHSPEQPAHLPSNADSKPPNPELLSPDTINEPQPAAQPERPSHVRFTSSVRGGESSTGGGSGSAPVGPSMIISQMHSDPNREQYPPAYEVVAGDTPPPPEHGERGAARLFPNGNNPDRPKGWCGKFWCWVHTWCCVNNILDCCDDSSRGDRCFC
ncbi:MAG: hypothetical protein M1827_003133 [Pycnora praestabilis]|nr:MAG: hypothetical protein M1827_003133 [Pycnora praestabilis]